MRKFLSLVLALTMMMSLITINTSAVEFTDGEDITYQEAVDVISAIHVVDGYENGSFNPGGNLSRGAAAKIICNLILGPTTASQLHADTAPFRDVPVTSDFAGYIAYCQKEGIISGYGDGTFRPAGTLTGNAFMKMLLGALGYDAEIEQYVGPNWTINVAKRAIGIGLDKGLTEAFNGAKFITREEAALYSLNTLKADLVEYENKITASVNGADVTIGNSVAQSKKWGSQQTRQNGIYNDAYIQFAEQYFNRLVLTEDVDVFGRPDREWRFDGEDIGAYINYDLFKQEYTVKVTGKDLYDLLGKTVIDGYKLTVTIDGETDTSYDSSIFGRTDMSRSNTKAVGNTGNGVLTQVFVDTDPDDEHIYIAVINTYLAKATEDYNEKDEEVDVKLWSIDDKGTGNEAHYVKAKTDAGVAAVTETLTVDVDDEVGFDITGIKKDDIVLARVADGAVQEIIDPEVLSEQSISSFKLSNWVVAEGDQIDYAHTAKYDEEVLDQYDNTNMKDVTYNVILDPYGYLIGLELNEDPDQYVFLTGMDLSASNLSTKTADANIIHMDGTMETVKVDMTKSLGQDGTTKLNAEMKDGSKNYSQLNTWCTYSVNSNGVYTLKEVKVGAIGNDGKSTTFGGTETRKVAQYAQDVSSGTQPFTDRNANTKTIDAKHVSLMSSLSPNKNKYGYVYANDNTTFINVTLENVAVNDRDHGGPNMRIIDDVDSITVGVKNVKLVMSDLKAKEGFKAPAAEIYTLYNKDGAVIAAVTIGDDEGTASRYVYVTSGNVTREDLGNTTGTKSKDGDPNEWTWHREVIIDGEKGEITEVGDNLQYIGSGTNNGNMKRGYWYEIKTNAEGNVRKAIEIGSKDAPIVNVIENGSDATSKYVSMANAVQNAVENHDTVLFWQRVNVNELNFDRGTSSLWTDKTAAYRGFSVSPDVKVVLCTADKNQVVFDEVEDGYVGYDGLEKAIDDMYAWKTPYDVKYGEDVYGTYGDATKPGDVHVSAILENGRATVIVINDQTPAQRRNKPSESKPVVPTDIFSTGFDPNTGKITTGAVKDGTEENVVRNNIIDILVSQGYEEIKTGNKNASAPAGMIQYNDISAVKDGVTRYLSADANLYYQITLNNNTKAPIGYIKANGGTVKGEPKITNSKTFVRYDSATASDIGAYYKTADAQTKLATPANKNINIDTGFYYVDTFKITSDTTDGYAYYFAPARTWTATFNNSDNVANYYTTAGKVTMTVDLDENYVFGKNVSVTMKALAENGSTIVDTCSKDFKAGSKPGAKVNFVFDIDADIYSFAVTVEETGTDIDVDSVKFYAGTTGQYDADQSDTYYGLTISVTDFESRVTPGKPARTTISVDGTSTYALEIELSEVGDSNVAMALGGSATNVEWDQANNKIVIPAGTYLDNVQFTWVMTPASNASVKLVPKLVIKAA